MLEMRIRYVYGLRRFEFHSFFSLRSEDRSIAKYTACHFAFEVLPELCSFVPLIYRI